MATNHHQQRDQLLSYFQETDAGKRWIDSFIQEVRRQKQELEAQVKPRAKELKSALVQPFDISKDRAEWLAQTLLEAESEGVLVPASIVLDAYIRCKVGHMVRKQFFQTALTMAVSCMVVELAKGLMKRLAQKSR